MGIGKRKANSLLHLRIALLVAGAGFIAGLYPLIHLWPDGFRWDPVQPEYEQMIAAVYAVLGIFLIRAASAPLAHLSLIWFTVVSSLAHAGVMALHAVADPGERGHLVADIPVLVIVATVLAVLTLRACGSTAGEEARR